MANAETIEFGTPHQRIDLGHGELAYWGFGGGPDVVFIHGWPLYGATFRHLIPTLAEHFHCHVFDLPGTGQTRWDADAPFGLWEHADTLRAALEYLEIDRYATVSHDSGGTIARLLATLTPGRMTALVMGNTEIPGHMPEVLRWAKLGVKIPGAAHVMSMLTRSDTVVEEMFRSCFADVSYVNTDFGELFVKPFATDLDYVRGQLRLVKHLDWEVVTEQLAGVHEEIEAPVLLVWGERDPWFPWKLAQEMVDSFGGLDAEAVLIPDGKLFVHEDFAEEFTAAALPFLREHA